MDIDRLNSALDTAVAELLSHMRPDGWWEGELSSSALSTATAISALSIAADASDIPAIRSAVQWLAQTQNADGGWGDTPDSPSNLATTLLCVAALSLAVGGAGLTPSPCTQGEGGGEGVRAGIAPSTASAGCANALTLTLSRSTGRGDQSPEYRARGPEGPEEALHRAQHYLTAQGASDPAGRVAAIGRAYGEDRTFAVPILMNLALAGLVPWEAIPPLPFELAALPHSFYKILRLHVVSYALPALIAIGLLLHEKNPPGILARLIRRLVRGPVLNKLQRIQPESGGFLEAAPLTSFVAMSLLPLLGRDHPVVARCLRFLRAGRRTDGSWPIDTNLSVWMTTSAVVALASAGRLDRIDTAATAGWIAAQQVNTLHPYTNAAPGGWAWTHLSGGVPDGDDTSGALLALATLGHTAPLPAGARWLLDLQNTDGGWPTFCRGWGKLPFDQSSPDITAHAVRALRAAGRNDVDCRKAIDRALAYLATHQRPDGSWVPLWFGNQHTPGHANPVLGTARALRASGNPRGRRFLLDQQNPDGGWGGQRNVASTVEETALAVSALADNPDDTEMEAIFRGAAWLLARIDAGTWTAPAPIGLYFASLWYSERLYPIIWTVEALGRVRAVATKRLNGCTQDGEVFTAVV